MASFQVLPDKSDLSSMIVLNTNGEEILYRLDTNLENSANQVLVDNNGKVVLNISTQDDENIIECSQIEESALLNDGLPVVLSDSQFIVQTIEENDVNKLEDSPEHDAEMKEKSDGDGTENRSFKCGFTDCETTMHGFEGLKLHALYHSDKSTSTFKCVVVSCKWSFNSMPKLRRHLESHLGIKEFHCDEEGCSKKFSTYQNLRTHKKLHARPLVQCLYCTQMFPNNRLRERHAIADHNCEPTFKCPKEGCDKKFHLQNCLSTHIKKHEIKIDELTCSYDGCNKVFSSRSRLKAHVRQHTGERPYSCTFQGCNWTFSTTSKLKRHARKHTGERKHVCVYENCGKSFMRPEHLKGHLLTHLDLKTFPCTHEGCRATFTARSSLYKHSKRHKATQLNKEQLYICPYPDCEEDCKTATDFEKHLTKHVASRIKNSSDTAKLIAAKSRIVQDVDSSSKENQSNYASLLGDQQNVVPAAGSSDIDASEFEAAINSISGAIGCSASENFNKTPVSPMKCVVNVALPLENNIANVPTTQVNWLNLDTAAGPATSDVEPIPTSRVQQENFSGSARTDYCSTHFLIKQSKLLTKQNSDVEQETKMDNCETMLTQNSVNENVVSPLPDLALAPNDVVLTSGAITFRDPTTGAHFIQTQLLQDDPPCIISDAFSEIQSNDGNSIHLARSLTSDPNTYIPISFFAEDENMDQEF